MYIIKIIYFTNVYNYSYESILKYVHFIFIHEIIVLFIYSNLILFRRRKSQTHSSVWILSGLGAEI
jgi:hypothetical protein